MQVKESVVEKKLVLEIKKLKGLCIKFLPFVLAGFPDRIVLLPSGRIYFVETKRPGKDIIKKSLQDWWRKKLIKLGFKHRMVNTEYLIEKFIHEIQTT